MESGTTLRAPTPGGEILFVVEEAPEGGFTAHALAEAIFTEADNLEELREAIRDAVRCHFDEGLRPGFVRIHQVRQEVFTT